MHTVLSQLTSKLKQSIIQTTGRNICRKETRGIESDQMPIVRAILRCNTIFHKVPKCLADNSALVPKCPRTEVSWVRSVCTPYHTSDSKLQAIRLTSVLVQED